METREDLVRAIAVILNSRSRESYSDTPDFMLAEHMVQSLEAFERQVRSREEWYGREVDEISGIIEKENP